MLSCRFQNLSGRFNKLTVKGSSETAVVTEWSNEVFDEGLLLLTKVFDSL